MAREITRKQSEPSCWHRLMMTILTPFGVVLAFLMVGPITVIFIVVAAGLSPYVNKLLSLGNILISFLIAAVGLYLSVVGLVALLLIIGSFKNKRR